MTCIEISFYTFYAMKFLVAYSINNDITQDFSIHKQFPSQK